jgi:prepilin-type N-terminal cleavage/methylation domain-containing protein
MKPRFSNQRNLAMTLIEVLVVIVVLAVLTLLFFPWPEPTARRKSAQINCVNNLHQIGLAYRSWAGDNNDKFPMEVSVTNGGAM